MPLNDRLFVSGRLHQRPVAMADGSVETIHFRELPWAEWFSYQMDRVSDDFAVREAAIARLIAHAVREPDGSEAISVERAKQLRTEVMNAFLNAVMDIQTEGAVLAKKPSPSDPTAGSGTS